jgi:hypothetical protein
MDFLNALSSCNTIFSHHIMQHLDVWDSLRLRNTCRALRFMSNQVHFKAVLSNMVLCKMIKELADRIPVSVHVAKTFFDTMSTRGCSFMSPDCMQTETCTGNVSIFVKGLHGGGTYGDVFPRDSEGSKDSPLDVFRKIISDNNPAAETRESDLFIVHCKDNRGYLLVYNMTRSMEEPPYGTYLSTPGCCIFVDRKLYINVTDVSTVRQKDGKRG